MTEKGNIISINTSVSERNETRIQSRKELIKKINSMGIRFMNLRLSTLFNNVDEYFFDRSGQSLAGLDSKVVFDAMRELRTKRDEIDKIIGSKITQQFQHLCKNELEDNTYVFDAERLSLVDDDNLEKSVCIKNIIISSTDKNRKELILLKNGMENLIGIQDINDLANPIGPDFLCNSFLSASNELNFDLKISLIILKHFERVVAKHLSLLYKAILNLLVKGGYIDEKQAPRNSQTKKQATNEHANEEEKLSEVNLINAINNIAAINNTINLPISTIKKNLTNLSGELSSKGLMQQILHVGDMHHAKQAIGLVNIIPSLIHAIMKQNQQNITQPDEDIINLSAMFFDFILNDKNQPERVRILVSKLQLPVVKLALNDREFFSKRNHPARRLINMIAKAGFGIADGNKEDNKGIYDLLENIVNTICTNKGETDRKLFAQQNKKLADFLARDDHRLKLIEKRLSQVETGKAKLESSDKIVESAINDSINKLAKIGLPIRRFVQNDWKQVLLQTMLKEGEESALWKSRSALLEEMIILSNKILNREEDNNLESRFGKLANEMLISLAEAAVDSAAKEIVFQNYTLFKSAVMMDRDKKDDKKENCKVYENPLIAQRTVKPYIDNSNECMPLSEEYIVKARDLAIGQWVEISSNSEDTEFTRCKLIAKIDLVDRFVFIDHVGKKVAELNRYEVALSLQNSSLKILNNTPLVERAINCISSKLNGSANDSKTVDEKISASVS